jgi:hypothetical protein
MEMKDKFFFGFVNFRLNQLKCSRKKRRIAEAISPGHPEDIIQLATDTVDHCTSDCDFNLFNFIEKQQPQFPVESVHVHYQVERGSFNKG